MSEDKLLHNYFKAAAKEAEINIPIWEEVIKIMGWDKK